ncbi:hypothetical protein [Flagellimonas nanhaiensis]|uniref:Adhesin domain-containing protein n=1 Tax=Flagellimonas nanhaiensis TaxID=2292706 RepID=A0A371JRA3_9FLAO|nr:hypothetical protein [Allomuricauda nanhaiensis]RDY60042.1 hypothetical protein DX873_11925 [Allomuricauda nanhaiensis]
MKNLIALLFLGLISLSINAQRIIEKSFDLNNRSVDLDVKFASDIEVKTWDKSTVYFKAVIKIKEEKYKDLYKLDIDETNNSITISSNTKALFKAYHDYWDALVSNGEKRHYHTRDMYTFNYVLYVPKNATFKVSSINGDLSSEIIEGDFTADLINGNIDIKKYNGDMNLKTINGEIDLVMKNSHLVAETIHGDIYADEKLELKVTDRYVGQKVEGRFDNGTHRLRLNTINGNMYLRL